MKIWITGSKGMLGHDLCSKAKKHFEVVESDKDVDIADEYAVSAFISKNEPNFIINCAAYTAVDAAETETKLNHRINAKGPKILGKYSAKANIGIAHVSTDYVLSGAEPEPLTEDAHINPMNAYGEAKAQGEANLARENPNHWIVRTAWLYGFHGKNFVRSMLHLMRTKKHINVVNDQKGNPTWTCDLADALLKIAANQRHPGIYNFSGEGTASWFDFAREIQKQALQKKFIENEIPIIPISSSEWHSAAKRPSWSVLDKTKIKNAFGINIAPWQESLSKYLVSKK